MGRNIGALGESVLRAWCNQVGIVCNPATDDRRGWDAILEFPDEGQRRELPLDLRPPLVTCLVQVKSSDRLGQSIDDVKVSNWNYLSVSPLPAFFLVLSFGGGDLPKEAFLVHVDRERVYATLRRVRELSVASKVLHRARMSLRWRDGDHLPELSGRGLGAAIRAAVGEDPRRYLESKRRWVETVGYEEGYQHGTLRFLPDPGVTEDESLAEFAIGIRRRLPAQLGAVYDARFGVDTLVTESGRSVFLELPSLPPTGIASIELANQPDDEPVQFRCSYYFSGRVFPFLPPRSWKLRYVAPGMDFIHHLDRRELTFKFDESQLDRPMPLHELYRLARFFEIVFRSGERGLHIVIEFDHEGRVELPSWAPGPVENVPEYLTDFTRGAVAAWKLAMAFAIDPSTQVSADEVIAHSDQLQKVAVMLSSAPSASIEAQVGVPEGMQPPDRFGFPGIQAVILGDRLLVVGVAAFGAARAVGTAPDGRTLMRIDTAEVVVVCKRSVRRPRPGQPTLSVPIRPIRRELQAWFEARGVPAPPLEDRASGGDGGAAE